MQFVFQPKSMIHRLMYTKPKCRSFKCLSEHALEIPISCAGTNAETIKPRLSYLRQRGLVPILNYAAEADVDQEKGGKEFTMDSECGREEARIQCNVHNMRQAISDCDNTTPSQGFVCGKVRTGYLKKREFQTLPF